MKRNIFFILKVLSIEIIYFFMMFFIFGIYLFLYFGSGAGSISSNAQFANNFGTWFIIISPIVFNLYMIFLSLKTKDIEKKNRYIIIQIIFIIFIIYQYNTGNYINFF